MRRHVAGGFTLLEQVIALAILTIGLTGAASLLGSSLRQLSINASHRFASTHAEVLLNRLAAMSVRTPNGASLRCRIATDPCFGETEIEAMLARWRAALRQQLPQAAAELTVATSASATRYQIAIEWRERDSQIERRQFERLLRS
jgi:prepilin-type N-terminal cleavage/methylation domain-containing protein